VEARSFQAENSAPANKAAKEKIMRQARSRCSPGLQSCALILILLGLSCPGRGEDSGGRGNPEHPSAARVSPSKLPAVWVSLPGVVDGLTCYALEWKPEKPTGRAVILLWGGWNNSVSEVYDYPPGYALVQELYDSGYLVLGLDQRGTARHGTSYHQLVDIGNDEVSDVISAVWWLKTESALEFLALVGVSHGGSLALRAAEEFTIQGIPVDAVWVFAPITDYQAWMDWSCERATRHCRLLKPWRPEQRFQGSPIHYYQAHTFAVFLVHGTKDTTVPVSQSRAWLEVDSGATLLEQPVDHLFMVNKISITRGLEWLNRIASPK